MLSVYTRHHPDCKNAGDRTWRRCSCPKWIWGSLNGKFIRQSAKTYRWEEAEEFRRQLSEGSSAAPSQDSKPPAASASERDTVGPPSETPSPTPKKPRVTIKAAVDAYLADAVSRNVAEATLDKLETIFRKQFLAWTRVEGFEFIDQIDLDALLNFRNTWSDAALAKQKKQSRVIGFFWACVRRRYLIENPALGLGKIKVVQVPTDYFPPDEFQRILDATDIYGDPRGGFIPVGDLRTRLHSMTQLMRWSGLRIRDAITLERHRLHDESLLLYQAKTGTPVYVPLPPHVVDALENLPPGPKPNPRYFFWSGNGSPKSAVADWQRSYRRLFELAGIRRPDGELKRYFIDPVMTQVEHQKLALIEAVRGQSRPGQEEKERGELQANDNAQCRRIMMGKLRQDKPVLRDALHPGADIRNQGTGRPQAEVEASQGAKGAGSRVLHARDGELPPWNWPK